MGRATDKPRLRQDTWKCDLMCSAREEQSETEKKITPHPKVQDLHLAKASKHVEAPATVSLRRILYCAIYHAPSVADSPKWPKERKAAIVGVAFGQYNKQPTTLGLSARPLGCPLAKGAPVPLAPSAHGLRLHWGPERTKQVDGFADVFCGKRASAG